MLHLASTGEAERAIDNPATAEKWSLSRKEAQGISKNAVRHSRAQTHGRSAAILISQIRESPDKRGFQRFRWCGRRDSNSHTLRRQNLNLVCLPISPRPQTSKRKRQAVPGVPEYGVDDGVRTHDRRSHNPVLYQLSYAHHIALLVPEPKMAHPAGLEPATIRLEGGCSIQLSYGRFISAFG